MRLIRGHLLVDPEVKEESERGREVNVPHLTVRMCMWGEFCWCTLLLCATVVVMVRHSQWDYSLDKG